MNNGLIGMLGRPDLGPSYNGMMVSSDGTASPVVMGGSTPMFQASGSVSGDVTVGQMSAGVLAVGVIALMLFYGWTRGSQK